MPRLKANQYPSYRLHKASGLAIVTLSGKDHTLGKYDSPASRAKYARLIAEWIANGRKLPGRVADSATCSTLATAWLRWAGGYYRKRDRPTKYLSVVAAAAGRIKSMFGDVPTAEMKARDIRSMRSRWEREGLAIRTVNEYTRAAVRCFRWGVEHELVPASVWWELKAIAPLKPGRSEARQTAPVGPVDDAAVEATVARLKPATAALVHLMRATGMRPGEACRMRPCDVDQSGEVWVYTPGEHKTEHHGRARSIALGPRAQAILAPLLDGAKDADGYLFPIRPGAWSPMTVNALGARIARAAARAGVPHWAPNRLRHSFATEARRRLGLDAAQVALGHANPSVTAIYAERDLSKAIDVAREIG